MVCLNVAVNQRPNYKDANGGGNKQSQHQTPHAKNVQQEEDGQLIPKDLNNNKSSYISHTKKRKDKVHILNTNILGY